MKPDDSAAPVSPPTLPAPSLTRRMSCWVYEAMLLFAVVFMASYLFSSLTQTRHGLQNRLGQQIFIFLVLGVYFTWFWRKGQTLAMKTWHIRALDEQGNPLTQRRAATRYVLSWIWFVPPLLLTQLMQLPLTVGLLLCVLWIIFWACLTYFRADRQFLHDHWAGTRMVDVRPAKVASA
ncbi:MAG: RDD family protein [Burkholderiales bacterium]